ncbi:DUF2617 family protein [Streptomyces sp. JNUCC 64]
MSGGSGIALATPYLDTDADQLAFSLGEDELPALATRELTVGGVDVRLRLLGASHQVAAGPVRETVACLPGTEGGLPDTARALDGWEYRFEARTRTLTPRAFSAEVDRVRRMSDGHPRSLYGIFPGAPEAVTALVADPLAGGVGWRTWHTYPQSRRIVATRTRLEAR